MSEESHGGPGDFAVGSLVAGYRLEEPIGRGGMAVVYRAHDPRLDRDVALKILAPGLSQDEAFRQRFIRESRAAAGVDEPHIIPVYEAGEDRGVLFIAMRFVRGGDVRSLLDRDGPLPPRRATEIISQVASALDAAHARGLVHRDVKPANMLLEESPDSDRPDHVYLADFGLTKASLGQATSGLTATGQFLGTLDYVAPEQVEGRPVDGRTDLYALGCAAFELLTGAPPFRSNEGMAVMYKQVSQPPPLLSTRRPGLPREADQVLNQALAKRPEDRYQSCREFAAALRRVFGLGSESKPPARPHLREPTQIATPVSRPADHPDHPDHADHPEHGPDIAAAAAAAGPAGPGMTEVSNVPGAAGGKAEDDTSVIDGASGDHEPDGGAAAGGEAAGSEAGPEPGAPPAGAGQPDSGAGQPGSADVGQPGPAAASPSGLGPPGPDAPGLDAPGLDAPGLDAPGLAAAGPAAAQPGPAGPRPAEPTSAGPGSGQPSPAGSPAAGPPTQAADVRRPTRPGLTDPSAGAGGPGGPADRGYGGSGGSGAGGGRRWWRSPVPIAILCAVVVIIGGGAFFLVGHHGGNNGTTGNTLSQASLNRCRTTTPSTRTIGLKSANAPTGPSPFAVRNSADGKYSFVSVKDGIEVWLNRAGKVPKKLRTIPVKGANKGLAMTSNGQYLVSANGQGAVVINVADAESGAGQAVVGTMTAPNLSPKGNNAVGVQVTPDNNFALVTMQNTTKMVVFNMAKAISSGFTGGYVVGLVPLFTQPVGISSPSKSSPWIYVTSFQRKNTGDQPSAGTLSIVNWQTAETNPQKSVQSTVNAGCSPARVVLTNNGATVWVTARDSNSLIAFSASKLRTDPHHALLADILIGPGPIGLSPAPGGKLIVADSNYVTSNNGQTGTNGELAIVDTAPVLSHQAVTVQVVKAMGQPRQVTLAPHDALLITEQNPSDAPHEPGQLQWVNIAKLP